MTTPETTETEAPMTRITPQVECMARAIFDGEWSRSKWPLLPGGEPPEGAKEQHWIVGKTGYISKAQDALSALAACPPSEGMVEAADATGFTGYNGAFHITPDRAYTAMLTRAVEEAKDE